MNPLFILLYFATISAVFVSGVPLPEEEDFDANEPLHEILKRSLIRDLGNPLTGVEKISKRSITRDIGPHLDGMEKISKRSVSDSDFAKEEDEESPLRARRYVFMPGFARRRQGRSVGNPLEEADDDQETNEENRERRAVFMPGFARRRSGRSVVFSPGFAKRRQGRSVDDSQISQVDEEEPTREKRAVFLPGFARRG